ncbi:MAG: HdeD family acid-resistance protein [Thermoleophilia bacterium]|nr:HdeD family acid-resistance protein [Thermoleophilia bacterium]
MSTAMPGLPPEIKSALGKSWKILLTAGIISVVLGAIAIILPPLASVTITYLVGILLLIGAVAYVAEAISRGSTGHRIWSALLAVLYVVAGVWLIINPISGTITLTWILATFFLLIGVLRLIAGISSRGKLPNSGRTIVNGVLSILIAVLVIGNLPSSAAWAIGLLVGIQLLFDGIALIATAMAGKQLAESGPNS